MKNEFRKKYLMSLVMFLLMGGHGFSQNSDEKNDERKDIPSVNIDLNKNATLTHTAPFNAFNERKAPENSVVKIGHFDEMVHFELWAFTNVIGKDLKLVAAPLANLNFFVKFWDKLNVGVNTTQMIQNYIDNKSMQPMTHNMYAYASFKMPNMKLYCNVGNFSILDYSSVYSKNMLITTFFTNALYLESGAYFPRAVVVGIDNDKTSLAAGYAENGTGLKFDGKDGYGVCMMEIKGEAARIGGLVKTNGKQTMGNIHLAGALTKNSDFLLQFLNLGKRAAGHVMVCYHFKDRLTLSANGYYQSKDGVAGGDVMLRDSKSGVYVGAGGAKNSPFYKNKSDGTVNEDWPNKMIYFIEIGVYREL